VSPLDADLGRLAEVAELRDRLDLDILALVQMVRWQGATWARSPGP
jgi:hypothetical protein